MERVEEREDFFAPMPPLESKKLIFRMVAALREQRRRRGLEEVKLIFIDVRKVPIKCEVRRTRRRVGGVA